MTWWEVALLVPLGIGIVAGIAGSILPMLPGPPIILGVAAAYAWGTRFRYLGVPTIIALAVLTVLSLIIDSLSGALGAAGAGASRKAVIGATLLATVGFFVGPLWLVLVLPLLGVWAIERLSGRSTRHSLKAAAGVGIGNLLTTVVRVVISVAMAVLVVVGFLT